MAKMKIFELKNLINEQTRGNIESKDIQDFLERSTGVKKTHSSNLEDNELQMVRSHFIPQTNKPAAPAQANKPAQTVGQNSPRTGNDQRSNTDQRPMGMQSGARHPETGQRTSAPVGTHPMGTGQAAGQRPAGQGVMRQGSDAGQRTAAYGSQGNLGSPSGQRPVGQGAMRQSSDTVPRTAGYGSQGSQRPAGQSGMRQGQVTGQRSDANQRPDSGQRTAGYGSQGSHGSQGSQSNPGSQGNPGGPGSQGYQTSQGNYHSGQRPAGQSGMHQGSESAQRNAGYGSQGNQGSQGTTGIQGNVGNQGNSGYQTSQGNYHSGQRPAGQSGMRQGTDSVQRTDAGQRSDAVNKTAEQSSQGYQGGQRQEGQQSGMQQRTTGQSSQGYQGSQRTDAGQRPAGQGGTRQGSSGQGYQGNQGYQRPDSGQRSNYQGNRQGTSGQGYQKPDGQVRTTGTDQGYQRPASQGNYRQNNQGNSNPANQNRQGGYTGGSGRPQGSGYSQNSNRPAGSGYSQGSGRPQGQGGYSQGSGRPQGQGGYSQGSGRPQGQGGYSQGGGRPQGQGGYSRPAGSGQRPSGGYNPRGMDDFKKDEDDKPSFNRAGQGAKRGPGGQKGNERKNFDQQILDQKVAEKNDFSNKRNRDRINKEKTYKDKSLIERDELDNDDTLIKSKLIPYKKGQFIQPKPIAEVKEDEIKTISIPEILTIKELADKMKMPASALVKKLFLAGKMVSINQEITFEEAEEIALGYEIIAEKEIKVNEVEELLKETEEDPNTMEKRPPVVCVMGHVDHGKTSLLDAIRETNVTSREAGGITQHIGAYVVEVNGEKITFLDTPGHEAFTSMRMRGAQSTDIAILVVAADDGVMPQTIEAINHAKAAGVQIIVAVNKIDKPSANVERVKQELTEYELVAEDWGGDTIFVPVSAHTKEGIERLLEMILLTAEMIELKANQNRNARGIVIEAELDKGRGPVATILVQKGTLKVGDNIVVGASFGKVRAMMDDKGRRVKEATPSTPVEILGLNEVPDAGETFLATDNEKEARTIADAFISQSKERLIADTKAKLSLDGLFSQIKAGNIKEFNLIIKADVQGSVEAMKQSLLKLSNEEVAVRIIHGGVGAINESDVILASASNAIIIGFNVRPDNAAKETSERENVEIKLYRVIYNAIDDIEAAMKGLLDPIFEERIVGHAEIRQTFKASGVGTIAGSYVLDGKIQRGCKARIYRDKSLIYEGILSSLKRFQDDVKEVASGYECGLVFDKFNDVKEGDMVELYIMAEVPR